MRINQQPPQRHQSVRRLGLPLIIAGFIALFLTGCAEIIEKDLSKQTVQLFAPTNQITIDTTSQSFYWDSVDGANRYELQVVSQRFDSILTIWADTTTANRNCTLGLPSGKYQWRVRAFNSSSTTPFCNPWSLFIN